MPTWVETLLWVAAAVTALWVVWTRGVVPVVKLLAAVFNTWAEVQKMTPILRGIADEFAPNDGASLRDRVDLIGLAVYENQRALEDRILAHDTFHSSIDSRITKLEA